MVEGKKNLSKEKKTEEYFIDNSLEKSKIGSLYHNLNNSIYHKLFEKKDINKPSKNSFNNFLYGNKHKKFLSVSKLISSLLLNCPLIIINLFFLIKNIDILEKDMVLTISMVIAGIWIFIGVPKIERYEYSMHPSFMYNLYLFSFKLEDPDIKEKALLDYDKYVYKRAKGIKLVVSTVWIVLVSIAFFIGFNSLSKIFDSKVSLIILTINVLYSAYLTSLGLAYCIIMNFTVKNLKGAIEIPFEIDDISDVGNYKIISVYSLHTTQALSTGVLFIPILANFIQKTKSLGLGPVVFLITIFSILLLISIVYPIYVGYTISSGRKSDEINKINARLNFEIDNNLKDPEEKRFIFIESLEKKIKQIEKIPIFPFEVEVGLSIISTVLMPMIIFFINLFLTGDVVKNMIDQIKNLL
ncbi:hypothetical protein [Peptoniphilus duerdenii]|uniref:hypothetical protein n=1 Tax=Peptoniphilus duerdenii TaxID=507750 RepID=UPI00288AC37D|nr:hypothetical protein [Peptoniphilus duerdenii]